MKRVEISGGYNARKLCYTGSDIFYFHPYCSSISHNPNSNLMAKTQENYKYLQTLCRLPAYIHTSAYT